MNQQIFQSRRCDGACETEAGCNCWSGVQVVGRLSNESRKRLVPEMPYGRELPYSHKLECGGGSPRCDCIAGGKLSESDLDARQAERDAATLRRRQAFMAAECSTEVGADDPQPLEWRDVAWLAGVMCAGGLLLATVAYAVFGN